MNGHDYIARLKNLASRQRHQSPQLVPTESKKFERNNGRFETFEKCNARSKEQEITDFHRRKEVEVLKQSYQMNAAKTKMDGPQSTTNIRNGPGSAEGTVETTKASCISFEELFAGLYICGKTEDRVTKDEDGKNDVAQPSNLSVPNEISFSPRERLRCPEPDSDAWEKNHVLLTSFDNDTPDECASLTESLLQRMKLKRRPSTALKMKVYVEPPKRERSDVASIDNSALTSPDEAGNMLKRSTGLKAI